MHMAFYCLFTLSSFAIRAPKLGAAPQLMRARNRPPRARMHGVNRSEEYSGTQIACVNQTSIFSAHRAPRTLVCMRHYS